MCNMSAFQFVLILLAIQYSTIKSLVTCMVSRRAESEAGYSGLRFVQIYPNFFEVISK